MKNPWTRRIRQIGKGPLQKKIEITNWFVLGTLLLVSVIFASVNFTLGLVAGGLVSVLNFYGLCRGLQSAFGKWETDNSLAKAPLILKYLLRMAAIGFVLYVLLAKTSADIFGIVLGLSTVVIAIILTIILTFFDKSYLEEV